MKYRKKPVVIEAVQYLGATNAMEVCDWINDEGGEAYTNVSGVKGVPTLIEIETLEGTMSAEPGDWVIRGVQGEFYPCKPDVFQQSYELAEEGT